MLEEHHEVVRGTVTVLDREPVKSASKHRSVLANAGRGAHYRLGEGITGRVVETGKPIVVPQVSREPMFLNRVGRRKDLDKQEITFVCVPVLRQRQTRRRARRGSPFDPNRDYEADLSCLRIVAAMMAQAVKGGSPPR